jgi:hypothetical protein
VTGQTQEPNIDNQSHTVNETDHNVVVGVREGNNPAATTPADPGGLRKEEREIGGRPNAEEAENSNETCQLTAPSTTPKEES